MNSQKLHRRDAQDGFSTFRVMRAFLFGVGLILLAVLTMKIALSGSSSQPAPSFSVAEFQSMIDANAIRSTHLTVYQTRALIIAEKRDSGVKVQGYVSNDQVPKIVRDLEESGVDVWIQGGQEPENNWVSFLIDGVPFLLLLVVFIIMMRRMRTSKMSDSAPGRPL